MKITLTINFHTHSIENIELPGQHMFYDVTRVIDQYMEDNNYDRDEVTSLVITCVFPSE